MFLFINDDHSKIVIIDNMYNSARVDDPIVSILNIAVVIYKYFTSR